MSNGWMSERRQQQALAIRRWCPWERSTGPRSADGKRRSSRNAFRGGERLRVREVAKALTAVLGEHRRSLRQLSLQDAASTVMSPDPG